MRKNLLVAAVIGVVLVVALGFGYAQTTTPGYAQGGWYCPWHNAGTGTVYSQQSARGWYCPWMAGAYSQGQGRGTGHGMMRHGGCMGYGNTYRGWSMGAQYGPGHNDSSPQNQTQ